MVPGGKLSISTAMRRNFNPGITLSTPQMGDYVIFTMCRSGVEEALRNMGFKWDSSGRLFRI